MVDYSVDSGFDLHFTENNDFAVVEGRAEFEQDLVIEIDSQFGELIGDWETTDTAPQKIELLVTRVAKKFDVIEAIKRLNVYEPTGTVGTLSVEIMYSSGETFEETL